MIHPVINCYYCGVEITDKNYPHECNKVRYKSLDNNKLPDNLEVLNIEIEAIGFKSEDAPKVKKLVRLKNKKTKLDKEIKELEDSLIK